MPTYSTDYPPINLVFDNVSDRLELNDNTIPTPEDGAYPSDQQIGGTSRVNPTKTLKDLDTALTDLISEASATQTALSALHGKTANFGSNMDALKIYHVRDHSLQLSFNLKQLSAAFVERVSTGAPPESIYPSGQYRYSPPNGNGLLNCGWKRFWIPNIAANTWKDQIGSLDFGDVGSVLTEEFPGFPNGFAVVNDNLGDISFETTADPSIAGLGSTDFMVLQELQVQNPSQGDAATGITIGEDAIDGLETWSSWQALKAYGFAVPGDDNDYPDLAVEGALPSDIPITALVWWTVADKTMHVQITGGIEYTRTLLESTGSTPDMTMTIRYTLRSGDVDHVIHGGALGLCKTPIPDATQRALLFAGTPFSAFTA